MNRKSLSRLFIAFFFFFLVEGCIYSSVQSPLDTDFDKTTMGTKIGESHFQSLLWLVAWGDAGSKAAADNGGITTIHHADVHVKTVLFGLYSRVTTVVYGD